VTRILVVDDDPQILRALRINLRARTYTVAVAVDGATALSVAAADPPDLVVLDLGLPDMDGVDVIRGLRGWTTVPIIVLSGRAGSGDNLDALDAGADDYVTKPFGVDELLARIRAVTRRTTSTDTFPPTVHIGQYTVDLASRTVTAPDSSDIRLTPTEWHLLDILVRNPGKLISQRQLLHQVWGPQYHRETQYLRQYMAQLRRKLEDDPSHPRHLITEPGMGYRFHPPNPGGHPAQAPPGGTT
jgi:two-component system KDP operon response regulator KdpE